jgi:hypothetical protein
MRKRVQIALAVVLVMLVGVIGWQVLHLREPGYQGKPLSHWLESQARNGYLNDETEGVIRQIGTNGIPTYLGMMAYKESPIKLRLIAHLPQQWQDRFHPHRVENNRLLGAYGLSVLGKEAKSSVPALTDLLNDKNPDVRYSAVYALQCLGPVAREALPSLINCLKDPEFKVQSEAIMCLGNIHQEADRVIPILVKLLNNTQKPDPWRSHTFAALWALGQFGAQARPAVPVLLGFLNDSNESIRVEATKALKAIDPEVAAKAGVK